MLPERRRKGLLTEELPTETIVYDTAARTIHCLNPVAALVWRSCDGATSEAGLAQIVRRELGVPADEGLIVLTLAKLARARLLEGGRKAFRSPSTRRQVLKQLAGFGVAAAAALVVTVAAPSPAHAQSNFGPPGCVGGCLPGWCCCLGEECLPVAYCGPACEPVSL